MRPLIRPANLGDLAALSALAVRAKAHWGYAPEDMLNWRDQLQISATDLDLMRIGVANVEGAIVGFYALLPARDCWALEHLWVAPEAMHRGLGRAMLAHALNLAFSDGATAVTVDADPNAEAFYRANGAVRTGEVAAPVTGNARRIRPQLAFTAAGDVPN